MFLVAISFIPSRFVSALTYETGTNVQFTFNPALSLSVSGDLVIADLSPNTASDSNIITVDVKTNNRAGYSLQATTGNTTHNTTELTNTTYTSPSGAPKFTSLNTTDDIENLSNLSPNTWGYSYSNNDGTTWANYSGLPLYTNTGTVISSNTTATEDAIKFKIAASAAATQAAGDYQNVVNFYLVANKPLLSFEDIFIAEGKEKHNGYYKMQDMTSSICNAVEVSGEDSQTKLIDIRDNNTYWVAKLDDNKCWMTQNLDLAIGTNGTVALTSENTDLAVSDTGIYTTDYSKDESGIITWAPTDLTLTGSPAIVLDYTSEVLANSVIGWNNTLTAPKMAEGGTRYLVGETVYQTRDDCLQSSTVEICDHKHNGNYYNWTAAIASSDSSSIIEKYEVAGNSICPKGWRLPTGPDSIKGSEFNIMLNMAGIADGVDTGSGGSINVGFKANGLNRIESNPCSFGRFGNVDGTIMYDVVWAGYYWSSSVVSENFAFNLYYNRGEALYPADQFYRYRGRNIRCIVN